MFLAWRDLRRTWRRFVLVGAVVALVAVLSTVLAGLADGLVRDGTSGVRALPYTNLAMEPGAAAVFSRSTVTEAAADAFRAIPGVEVSPLGVSFVNAASTSGGASLDLALFGVPAGSFLADRPDAQDALAGPARPRPLLDVRRRGREGRRRATASAAPTSTLPVVGFTIAGSYGHVPIAFTSLATWQSIAYGSDARGRVSAIALKVPAGSDRRRGRGRRRVGHRGDHQGALLRRLARLHRRDHHHDAHPGVPARHLGAHRRRLLHRARRAAHPPDRAAQGHGRVRRLRAAATASARWRVVVVAATAVGTLGRAR